MKSRLINVAPLHLLVHFLLLKQGVASKSVTCTKGGHECVFPFSFGGSEYSQCISGIRGSWCGIKSKVTENKRGTDYDYCRKKCPPANVVTCTKDGYKCQFPFFHNGKNYSRCIKPYSFLTDKAPWCGITADGKVARTCAKHCPEKGPMIWTTTTKADITTEQTITQRTITSFEGNVTSVIYLASKPTTLQSEMSTNSSRWPSNVTIQDISERFILDPTLIRTDASSRKTSSSIGVGIAIAMALLIIFGLAAYVFKKRRRRQKNEDIEKEDKATDAAIPLRETTLDDHAVSYSICVKNKDCQYIDMLHGIEPVKDNSVSSPEKSLVAEESRVPVVSCVVNGKSELSN